MTDNNFTLFTLFGLRVRANPSWLLLAALILWSLSAGLFPYRYPALATGTYWLLGTVGTVGLFFSLLFHEFSHALVARHRGLKIGGITLFLFGGVAELGEDPPTPRTDFEVSVAGPVSSLFLAVLFTVIANLVAVMDIPQHWVGLFNYLAMINLVLALFNLVPGFPLDGGRLLRAWLWHKRGDKLSATRTASKVGQAFGIFLIVLGIFSLFSAITLGGMWWILIGFFVWHTAGASYRALVARTIFHGTPLHRFVRVDPITVEADISIEHFITDYAYRYHYSLYPVTEDGKLIGCIRTRDVKTIRPEDRSTLPVREITQPCTEKTSIDSKADVEQALIQMQKHQTGQLIVLDHERLAGIITLRDLLGHLAIRRDISEMP